jgi:zinc transporter 1/2/3
MSTLTIIKLPVMIIMFLLVVITGSIPYRSEAFKSSKKAISYTMAFSGGLFLSVGLLHILPEAN